MTIFKPVHIYINDNLGCQDTQHNDIKHNDIQHHDIHHNDIQHHDTHDHDIQHNPKCVTQHNGR